jgi:peptidoglycan/LPS O-acetylase OafA/YrhL
VWHCPAMIRSAEPDRNNSFDVIRLLAAFAVLIGHSYALLGLPVPLVFGETVHGIGVSVFFAISGYLVSQSALRDPQPIRYFLRRSARIFPALWVCVLLSIVVMQFVSTLGAAEYYGHSGTLNYLNNLLLKAKYRLPGVFTDSAVSKAINGSLWSLPAEFMMYILVIICCFRKQLVLPFLVLGFVLFWGANQLYPGVRLYGVLISEMYDVGRFFFAGMLLCFLGPYLQFRADFATLFIVALAFLPFIAPAVVVQHVLPLGLAYGVISLGLAKSAVADHLKRRVGDISYGVYLYAFPVQQMWINVADVKQPLLVAAATTVVVIPLGWLSWRFVERPSLTLVRGYLAGAKPI